MSLPRVVCNECGSQLPGDYCHQFGCVYDGNAIMVCLWCIKKASHFIQLAVEGEQAKSTPQEITLTNA